MYYSYEYSEVVLEMDGQGNQLALNLRGISLISRTADSSTA